MLFFRQKYICDQRDVAHLLFFVFRIAFMNFLYATNHQTRSQAVARIADRTAKNCRGYVTQATPTFMQGKLFVRPLGIPDTKLHIPNLKSLAQVVFEILRAKRIEVTSLTPICHFLWNKTSISNVSEIFNVKCNATVT